MQKIVSGIIGLVLIALGAYLVLHYKRPADSGISEVATTTPATLVYTHTDPDFEVTYPRDFSVRESYVYQELGPGKDVPGVAFMIPMAFTEESNLSTDSYISVEWKPGTSCSMTAFLENPATTSRVTDSGIIWEVASSTGAAAGNRYEEMVFLKGCTAVRYFIHYGVIGNYPEGSVREFDRDAVMRAFDTVRRGITLQ